MANATKPSSLPHRVLSILAAALVGCAIGVGIFGIGYSEMTAYLGDDPATCANCHVMQDYYDLYLRGGHANVATCNDCHLPHGNELQKYAVKLEDGVLHGYSFTLGLYPKNIVARDASREVINNACLSCHDMMTTQIRYLLDANQSTLDCTRCHSTVGHDK